VGGDLKWDLENRGRNFFENSFGDGMRDERLGLRKGGWGLLRWISPSWDKISYRSIKWWEIDDGVMGKKEMVASKD
jgi:hypothetical protein